MKSDLPPAVRDLCLVGGGHAHVQVLRRFGMQPVPGIRLTLISPLPHSPYSGMLPACVAGVYTEADIHIDLVKLSRFAGARFIQAEVTGLDLDEKRVELLGRPSLKFDALSINTGATPKVTDDATAVKPISTFLPRWRQALAQLKQGDHLALIGGGAGGIELALAARQVVPTGVRMTLVSPTLVPSLHPRAAQKLKLVLQSAHIGWVAERATHSEAGTVKLASGTHIDAEQIFWVTGVAAPQWVADSPLQTDEGGFIRVGETLQSQSHDFVFAAGDIAELDGQSRPKSGVFAVRQGPVLAYNLAAYLQQQSLKPYRAQGAHLALIGTTPGRALAVRGGFVAEGKAWWALKRWIDERFMSRFNDLPEMFDKAPSLPQALQASLPDQAMRCGGCGAKIAAEPLRRVLTRLPAQEHPRVRLGIGDDAAEIISSGSQLLTIDGFRAMLDDPYLFGRIATHHSLNDILAMGAKPLSALALVTVPLMAESMMEEDLYQMLAGVCAVLADEGAVLVGGHSAEGAELSLGLTIMGEPREKVLTKGGAQVGDRLILTKPLGTGTVLAAAMQGMANPLTVAEVVRGMDQSNGVATSILRDHQTHALTDVTGFGLAGHLGEMLRASKVGVRLDLDRVPIYGDGLHSITHTVSSIQQANELALQEFELSRQWRPADAAVRLLADPQTSGGLLACVPVNMAALCVEKLVQAGYAAADIGEIQPGAWILD